jgi:hypothetical protein
LAYALPQFSDFVTVQQELTGAARLMVEEFPGLFTRRHMGVHQPSLSLVDLHIRFCQADVPGSNRFYFTALQGYPGF